MAKAFAKAFYNSKEWRELRLYILNKRDRRTCAYCGARATEVHHLIELNEKNINDPNISLNPIHLQSLCHECHAMITMQEHGIKNIDCDIEYYFDEEGMLQQRVPPVGKNKSTYA